MHSESVCAKDKLKPWLVGLIALIIVMIGWLLLGKAWKPGCAMWKDKVYLGKANIPNNAGVNKPAQNPSPRTQTSYRRIVKLVKPAVVVISLPNAQPFLQKWGVASGIPKRSVSNFKKTCFSFSVAPVKC